MSKLRCKRRNAELSGDIDLARKTGKALDGKERQKRKREKSIRQQMILVHECQDKAIPEERKFHLRLFLYIKSSLTNPTVQFSLMVMSWLMAAANT